MTGIPQTSIGAFVAGLEQAAAKQRTHPDGAANVRLLLRAYSDLMEGRTTEFAACFSDDVEFEISGMPAWNCRVKGKPEMLAAAARNFGAVAEQHPDVKGMAADGDDVVVNLEERGKLKDGTAYHLVCTQWFKFANGKITRLQEVIAPRT